MGISTFFTYSIGDCTMATILHHHDLNNNLIFEINTRENGVEFSFQSKRLGKYISILVSPDNYRNLIRSLENALHNPGSLNFYFQIGHNNYAEDIFLTNIKEAAKILIGVGNKSFFSICEIDLSSFLKALEEIHKISKNESLDDYIEFLNCSKNTHSHSSECGSRSKSSYEWLD